MSEAELLLGVLKERRSVRRFKPREVPIALLSDLVEAATWAPSASNRQDWHFVMIASAAVIGELAAMVRQRWEELIASASESGLSEEIASYAGNFDWFGKAPALFVVTCRRSDGFLEKMVGADAAGIAGARTSAAMATQNLMLAAHASGLGSCCLTGPLVAGKAIKKRLGIAARQEIVCLVALGYPAEDPRAPERRPVGEVATIIIEERSPETAT
ncbi:MAG: nitroreductase family protein [Deltaproteobacteria bacterium]|nr:nitroreductase family protein [Deltaproteobacteria bacterium]